MEAKPKTFFNVKDAAAYAGVCTRTMRLLTKTGEVKSITLTSRHHSKMVMGDSLREWMAKRNVGA